jgi:[protein-PII] uridylyltransferase
MSATSIPAQIPALQERMRKQRDDFRAECRNEVPGVAGARTYAWNLLHELQTGLDPRDLPGRKWAVVAVGGFGRGALSFSSDLDLLFLYGNRLSTQLRDFVQDVVYGLWDVDFEVGQVVSSVSGLNKLMREDFSAQTTYLEPQFILGDRDFFQQWHHALLQSYGTKQQKRFLHSLLQYREKRFSQFGESIYLLEPQIKEGPGALRDLHSLRWTGLVLLGTSDLQEFASKGWITQQERQWLEKARDFLWRVRLQVHLLNGRKQDRLLLQDQKQLAEKLEFREEGTNAKAVEAFMRQYYRHTARIRRVTSFLLDRLDLEMRPGRNRGRKRKVLPGPFIVEGEYIRFHDPDIVPSNPSLLMDVFWYAAKYKARFLHETGQIIRDSLAYFTDEWRRDPRAVEKFFDILLDRENAYYVLRTMMEVGFLECFIPDFSNVRYQVQYDEYHVFTVDEHLLRCVSEMHGMLASGGESEDPQGRAGEIDARQERAVFLAALIHDIGKGEGPGHASRGAATAGKITADLGMDREQSDLVAFLVENHLLLAETALKRDLSDEKPIERCALQVGTRKRLLLLYLLTVADSKATGSHVWSNWRRSLLQELYVKVDHYLQSEEWQGAAEQRQILEKQRSILQEMDDSETARQMRRWLEGLSLRYLRTQSPEAIRRHFRMEQSLANRPVQLDVRRLEGEMWELAIVCPDRRGLFDLLTGVLLANGLNILAADIFTRDLQTAIDVLIVDRIPDPLHPDELWERLRKDLEDVLTERRSLQEMLDRRRTRLPRMKKPLVPREDEVVIDERASDFYTVIEVYTWERPGVLHAISKTLHEYGLSIQLAKISTPGAQVLDVFYVTDEEGNKIHDPETHGKLKQALLHALRDQGAD